MQGGRSQREILRYAQNDGTHAAVRRYVTLSEAKGLYFRPWAFRSIHEPQ